MNKKLLFAGSGIVSKKDLDTMKKLIGEKHVH